MLKRNVKNYYRGRISTVIAVLIFAAFIANVLLLSGCGKMEAGKGILPDQISCSFGKWNFTKPSGTGDYSQYTDQMLYGKWQLEGYKTADQDVNDALVKGMKSEKMFNDFLKEGDDGYDAEVGVFPLAMRLGYGDFDAGEDGWADIGGISSGKFLYGYQKSDRDSIRYDEYQCFYDVNGNTLAIGIPYTGKEILQETKKKANFKADVYEKNYQMDWTGTKLTLSYDGKTAVYVPDDDDLLREDGTVDASQAGRFFLAKGSKAYENLYEIFDDHYLGLSTLGQDPVGNSSGMLTSKNTYNIDGTATFQAINGESATAYSSDKKSSHSGSIGTSNGNLYLNLSSGERIQLNSIGDTYSFDRYYLTNCMLTLEKDGQKYYFIRSGQEDYGASYAKVPKDAFKIKAPEMFDGKNKILPKEVKKDKEGNWTYKSPKGAGDHSSYLPEMFYGEWELKGGYYDENLNLYKTSSQTGRLGYTTDGARSAEYCLLPSSFDLGYAVSNGDTGLEKEIGGLILGTFRYPDAQGSTYADFIGVYDTSGDTLAVGFSDLTDDQYRGKQTADSFKLAEIDYQIEWTGAELTLTYNGESAVYVPHGLETKSDGTYDFWSMRLGAGQSPQGSIYGFNNYGGVVLSSLGRDDGSGKTADGNVILRQDGTAEIDLLTNQHVFGEWGSGTTEDSNGKFYAVMDDGQRVLLNNAGSTIKYDKYCFSGMALTFVSGSNKWVYFDKYLEDDGIPLEQIPDKDYTVEAPSEESFEGTVFKIDGEDNATNVNYSVNKLTEAGFKTDADLTKKLDSREVSGKFTMVKNGVKLIVRAVNPYARTVALSGAVICYVQVKDTSGKFTVGRGISPGKSTLNDVLAQYTKPLKQTARLLIYRTQNPSQDIDPALGELLLNDDTTTCYVSFHFSKKGKLSSVEMESTGLLYNSLQDNVGNQKISELSPDILKKAQKTRNSILQNLKQEFKKQNIDVDIDPATGKIILENNVLFGFNEYALAKDGKAYLDSFMASYVNSVLKGKNASAVSEIHFDGYCDTTGSYEFNLDLSQKRANAVLDYCTNSSSAGMSSDEKQTFESHAKAVGHSYENPIYGKDGNVDMAASRRVEINFVLNLDQM